MEDRESDVETENNLTVDSQTNGADTDAMMAALERIRPTVSSGTVYHYCSAATLQRIIEGQSILATDYRYLNDPQELVYADELICDVACAPPENLSHSRQKLAYELYVTCFSTDGDSLPQWRAYGDDGRGFAIGFDLSQMALSYGADALKARPVLYDEEEQRALLLHANMTVLAALGDNAAQEGCDERALFGLQTFAPTLKHRAYREECEVRYVVNLPALFTVDPVTGRAERRPSAATPQRRIREKNGKLIPYIALKPIAEARLPITEIVMGPGVDYEKARQSIIWLLTNAGYDYPHPDQIRCSEIRYQP